MGGVYSPNQDPQMSLWQLLHAAKMSAKPEAQVFAYVDFTAKEMLPMWIPASAMVGQAVMNEVKEDVDEAVVGLAKSLTKTIGSSRMIMSLAQWCVIFERRVLVAVAIKQVTWGFVLTQGDNFEDRRGPETCWQAC